MTRLTKPIDKTFFVEPSTLQSSENGCTGEAINKLATYENIQEDLLKRQDIIAMQLEKLRKENKEKTTQFRQLLAEKIMNNNILILFKTYGL